jgi:uncharacterized lipoprotein YmbA
MNRCASFPWIMAMLFFFSGCASPPAQFYTLNSVPVVRMSQSEESSPIAIAFDPVTVPEFVDRAQLVSRRTENRVFIDEFARWADPLKVQIARVLAADVARFVPAATVSTYPQRSDAEAYQVTVDVETFDTSMGDMVTIAASWSVKSTTNGARIKGRTVVREFVSAQGYESIVKAHSRALASVASDIATATLSLAERVRTE